MCVYTTDYLNTTSGMADPLHGSASDHYKSDRATTDTWNKLNITRSSKVQKKSDEFLLQRHDLRIIFSIIQQ